jgi:hypothetical protein
MIENHQSGLLWRPDAKLPVHLRRLAVNCICGRVARRVKLAAERHHLAIKVR